MATSGEDGGGSPPRPARPARRRMSSDELEPAPREAVPVVSFDDLDPAENRSPASGGRLADFATEAHTTDEPDRFDEADAAEPDDLSRTTARDARSAEAWAATGPDPDRERRAGLVDLDALEPGGPAAHEAADLGHLDAPAEQATVLSLEDLRIRRARRSDGAGRDRVRATARSADREPRRGTGRRPGGERPAARPEVSTGPGGSDREVSEVSAVPEDTRPPEEQEAAAKEICLRLLTDRARSKHELATKLRQKGVADEIAEKVLERFDEVGLIDDQAFADAWVRSRHRARGLGRRAIAQELRRKGVAKEIADTALTEVDDAAEEQRARDLVDRRLRTMTVAGPEDRQKAGRRLLGMLARKGYPPPIAYRVVRTALAEHGADEDELGPGDLD
ncbi:recombination regulator RecX [Pseudonocardia kujensis]|uniref:recombination regulator RecX n=1 Tax=Pseudonocardia kujensis TaxID=1128675 RepID=UPI0027DFD777|nr:recombination regulator RecX [Pseudonocardia kujensis]